MSNFIILVIVFTIKKLVLIDIGKISSIGYLEIIKAFQS